MLYYSNWPCDRGMVFFFFWYRHGNLHPSSCILVSFSDFMYSTFITQLLFCYIFSEEKSGKPLTKLFLQTIFQQWKSTFLLTHWLFLALYLHIRGIFVSSHFFLFLHSYFLLGTRFFFTILLLQVFHIFFISQECEINTALLRTCFHHFMECWTFNFGYKICVRSKLILSLHWKKYTYLCFHYWANRLLSYVYYY